MKKYCLTYMAAIAALSASAAAPQAERKTDSLHIASLSPREAATIDSIVAMRLRLQPKQIESIFDTNDVVAIDTASEFRATTPYRWCFTATTRGNTSATAR